MPTLPRLNLIGPGKVGLALALAWHRAGAVHVAGVLASSADKAQAAVSWLGAGSAVAEAAQLPPAEFTLIATPDGKIADMAARLAAANVTPAGAVVWHASGALAHGQGALPGLFVGGGLGTPGGAGLVVGGRGITVLQLHKPFGGLQGDLARQRERCGSGNRS